jgi:hypothetical protein
MKEVGLSKIEGMIYLIRGQKVMLDSEVGFYWHNDSAFSSVR